MTASSVPQAAPLKAPSTLPDPLALQGVEELRYTGLLHEALRESEAAMVRARGAAAVLPSTLSGGPRVVEAAPERFVFDDGTSCSGEREQRTALLLGANDVMAIYQDSVELPGQRLANEYIQLMLSFFASYGKDVVESYFGAIPDVDANGRVYVVATAHAFSDPLVVAYVWAGNYYNQAESCPASDEAEVIFFNPARIRSMAKGEYIALGVLSHESQHLISLYNRLRRTLAQGSGTFLSHPTWIEEGRAELADEVTSRYAWSQVGGPARNAQVSGEDLHSRGFLNGRCCKPEAYGVGLHAAWTAWYLSSQPNGLVVAPTAGIQETDIRNGGWLFHRWVGDAFGKAAASPGGDAAIFRQLTDSLTASGTEGLESVLGSPFDVLFSDFAAAIMLHGTGTSTGAPGFSTYDFVTLTEGSLSGPGLETGGVYPWPVTSDATGVPPSRSFQSATYAGPIGPTGLRIHDFTSNGTGTGALLSVRGLSGLKLVVVRLD